MRITVRSFISLFYLAAGVLCAAIGLRGFLIPVHLIDGGVTGISMLSSEYSQVPISLWLVIINLPFVILGTRQVSLPFALKCGLSILALAVTVHFLVIPPVTHDRLLSAVFGGVFLGAGIGLSIRGGGVLDGTEILALIVGRKFGATVGSVILGLNVVIFAVAAYVLSVDAALYSMLTYLAASKTVDFLLYGIEAFNGMLIMSPYNDKIREAIIRDLGRGVTVFKGRGGYSSQEQEILYCVLTRLEIVKAKGIITEIDENAFIVMQPVNEVKGGIVKRARHQI